LYEVADELGETVHGLAHLNERLWSLIVESLGPRRDGQRRDEQPSSGLRQRPGPGNTEFENREPFDRRVVRMALGRDAFHARVLNSDLFIEERDLPPKLVILSVEAGTGIELMFGTVPSSDERDVGHRNRVDNGGADAARPVLGKWSAVRYGRNPGQRGLEAGLREYTYGCTFGE
jgi:hypothetical protein